MKSSGNNSRILIDRFLEMMSAERGAAANTLAAYGRDLEAYADFLAEHHADPSRAEAEDLRQYLAQVEAEGLKTTTAARRLSAVRQFHKFLYGEGLSKTNPAGAVDSPKIRRGLPKVLSIADVDRLLDTAKLRIGKLEGAGRAQNPRGDFVESIHHHKGQGRARASGAGLGAGAGGGSTLSREQR